MKIFKPNIRLDGNEVSISARVEVNTISTELWFKFPAAFAPYITDRADAFAAALLPLAMNLGENLEIDGGLSPRLAHGMHEYQRIQASWKPDFFKVIDITWERLTKPDPADVQGAVGSAFSGGVDSYHTLWTHLQANEPNPAYRLSHCLMINGFDNDSNLENPAKFSRLKKVYEPMLANLNIQLIVANTNIRELVSSQVLKQSFGAVAASPALALGSLFSCFYIPSSYKFSDFYPDGSHLLFDNMLSTEALQIIHDAPHLTRVQKTKVISAWAETASRLKVCFNAIDYGRDDQSVENCCRCDKCLRTMATLDLFNALPGYSAFPHPLERARLRKMDCVYPGLRIFAIEILKEAVNIGRKDVAFDIIIALCRSIVMRLASALAGIKIKIIDIYCQLPGKLWWSNLLKPGAGSYFTRGGVANDRWKPRRSSICRIESIFGRMVLVDSTTKQKTFLKVKDVFIWNCCNGRNSVADINRMLCENFSLMEEMSTRTVSEVLQNFLEQKFIRT